MAPWGWQKHSSYLPRSGKNCFLKSKGVKGRDTQNVQGVQSNFFNSQGGGTIFQAKEGVQSRTTKAKGGNPPPPPPFGHI